MGNYKSRRPGFLLGWQMNVAELMFRGYTDEEIAIEQFHLEKGDKEGLKKIRNKLYNLRRSEKFQEYYRSIVGEWSVHHVGKALTTIANQMDNPNPWIANKAANDVLLQSKGIMTGSDDNTVVVKVEGMPELGTPDD